MNLTRNEGLERTVLDAMRQSFEEPRSGIHLTDLLNPRYTYWKRNDPKPLTDEEVLYFLAGRGHEVAFGLLHGFEVGQEITREGITTRADFYLSIPIEFKTRRRNLAKTGHELSTYETYLEQVKGEAALYHRSAAWLWILSLLEQQEDGSTRPELRCYEVTFSPEELEAEQNRLQHRKVLLETALSTHNHRPLPLCWAFLCGKQSKTMVQKPRCTTCAKEFLTDWGLGKHTESRPNHRVAVAKYAWDYQPKCKWYTVCQPYLDDPQRGSQSSESFKAVKAVKSSSGSSGSVVGSCVGD